VGLPYPLQIHPHLAPAKNNPSVEQSFGHKSPNGAKILLKTDAKYSSEIASTSIAKIHMYM